MYAFRVAIAVFIARIIVADPGTARTTGPSGIAGVNVTSANRQQKSTDRSSEGNAGGVIVSGLIDGRAGKSGMSMHLV